MTSLLHRVDRAWRSSSFASRRAYAHRGGHRVLSAHAGGRRRSFRTVATGDVKRYAILANPIVLINGFAQWLFDIEARRRSAVGRADLPGQLYLYVMLAVCAVCIAIVWLRVSEERRMTRHVAPPVAPSSAAARDRRPRRRAAQRFALVRQRRRGERRDASRSDPASPVCSARMAPARRRSCT